MPTLDHSDDPESTNSFERAHVAAEHARARLSAYPNVVSVGVGTKQTAGAVTETWCVSVSVRKKLAPAELPANAIIPAEFDGVPTDVVEIGDQVALMLDPKDGLDSYELNTYHPLRGGIKLSTSYASTSGIQPDVDGYGTLGSVVLTTESPPRHVALTNRHVVADVLPNGPVGHPHTDPGSTCCGSTEIIGNVWKVATDTVTPPVHNIFPVDAALCALNAGVTWVPGIGTNERGTSSPLDPITGIRDLRPPTPPPPNLQVRKRGARSGFTTGRVTSPSTGMIVTVAGRTFLGYGMSDPAASPHPYFLSLPVMQIQTDFGPQFALTAAATSNPCKITAPGHTFTLGEFVFLSEAGGMTELNNKSYRVGTIDAAAGTLTLLDASMPSGAPVDATKFTPYTSGGTVASIVPFLLPGDSGSLVRDANNKVVGLLFSTTRGSKTMIPGFISHACHIEDVFAAMKVTLPPVTNPATVMTAPANNNPHKDISTVTGINAMAKLQNDLLDTERGVAIARAIMQHEREVRALIAANRRVAARWRHVSAARLVERFVATLFEPALPIMGTMAAEAKRALRQFADVLERYASQALRDDVARWRETLIAMTDLTYRDALIALGPLKQSVSGGDR